MTRRSVPCPFFRSHARDGFSTPHSRRYLSESSEPARPSASLTSLRRPEDENSLWLRALSPAASSGSIRVRMPGELHRDCLFRGQQVTAADAHKLSNGSIGGAEMTHKNTLIN